MHVIEKDTYICRLPDKDMDKIRCDLYDYFSGQGMSHKQVQRKVDVLLTETLADVEPMSDISSLIGRKI